MKYILKCSYVLYSSFKNILFLFQLKGKGTFEKKNVFQIKNYEHFTKENVSWEIYEDIFQ